MPYTNEGELVKAHKELQSKIRVRDGAPEKYDLKFPETFKIDEAQRSGIEADFKLANLSQSAAQEVVNLFAKHGEPIVVNARKAVEEMLLAQEWKVDLRTDEGRAAYKQRGARILGWAKNQPGMADATLKQLARSAGGLLLLESKMEASMMQDQTVNVGGSSTKAGDQKVWTRDDVAALKSDPRAQSWNPKFDQVFSDSVQKIIGGLVEGKNYFPNGVP